MRNAITLVLFALLAGAVWAITYANVSDSNYSAFRENYLRNWNDTYPDSIYIPDEADVFWGYCDDKNTIKRINQKLDKGQELTAQEELCVAYRYLPSPSVPLSGEGEVVNGYVKNWTKAWEHLNRAYQKDPNYGETAFYFYLYYKGKGNIDEAMKWLERYSQLDGSPGGGKWAKDVIEQYRAVKSVPLVGKYMPYDNSPGFQLLGIILSRFGTYIYTAIGILALLVVVVIYRRRRSYTET